MKKYFFVIATLVSFNQIFAQEPADALRYSWITPSGTARQQAIGGAMTSLGGDISATFVNPAGLAFYKTGDFVLSPGFRFNNNKSSYFGRTELDKRNSFTTGLSGLVMGGSNNRRNPKSNSAFAVAINRTASFGSNLLYRGVNTQSSYSQKFLEELRNDNVTTDAAAFDYPFSSSLAINTFWIDTAAGWNSGNKTFRSLATPLLPGGLIQEKQSINRGGITELALAFAGTQNEKLFYGVTVGIPFLNYDRESTFTEADATDDPNNQFDFATFTENLTTKGTGLNLKLGLIYKPAEQVRLGFAFHSPTLYSLTDVYNASITTDTENFQGLMTQNSRDITNGPDGEFSYWLITPYKISASASYVLREIQDVRRQKGFITADIEYVNYKASSYKTDPETNGYTEGREYFKSLNKAIDNSYKGAFNFKVGGELKFTTIMARLGAAYYGNPYQDIAGEKGSRFSLSGGLGYRHKGIFIDLGYVHMMGKDVDFAYRLQNAPITGAQVRNTTGTAIVTVGFKI